MTCGRWSHNYVGGVCLNGCGIPQNQPKHEEQKDLFGDYQIKEKKVETLVAEVARPAMQSLRWDIRKGLTVLKMERLYWMACQKLFTYKQTQFKERIAWAVSKKLHIMQFVKMVNTICTTKKATK